MINEYELRLANIKDAARIGNLSRTIIEYELGWSWTPQRIVRNIIGKNTNVVVAKESNRVIGFALMGYLKDEAHLNLFGVDPDYQRQGIGTKLVEWLEQTALVSGIGIIYLETRLSNEAGRKFYQYLGYKTIQHVPQYYDGKETAIRLAKDLWLHEYCQHT